MLRFLLSKPLLDVQSFQPSVRLELRLKSLVRIDNIDNFITTSAHFFGSQVLFAINLQAGFRLAPPTKNPSISACFASSLQFFSLTLPPYSNLVFSAASFDTVSFSHLRIAACTSCACSVLATLPVPIALRTRRLVAQKLGSSIEVGKAKDVPNRFVRNHDLRPIFRLVRNSLQLPRHHINRLVCLSLLQRLSAANNDTQPSIKGSLRFASNKLPSVSPDPLTSITPASVDMTYRIILLQHHPPLRMSHQRPPNLAIRQLLRRYLAGERSVRLVEHILAADFDFGFEMFADEKEEEAGRCDDDFCSIEEQLERSVISRGTI